MPRDAIWYNENNIAQHKNLGDAFLLRLFKGIIVKIANADDIRVSELYARSRKEGNGKFQSRARPNGVGS